MAYMMPTQVSISSGVRPPWWPLNALLGAGRRLQRRPSGPGAGSTQTSARRSRRRGPASREELGGEADRARRRARCAARATTVSRVVDVQEHVARRARGRASAGGRAARGQSTSSSSVTCDVDLPVVGGHEQRCRRRFASASSARSDSCDELLRLDGPCRWPGGVDPVPVEVAQPGRLAQLRARRPRSSRTARRRRPRAPPSRRACRRSPAAGRRVGGVGCSKTLGHGQQLRAA